MVAEHVRSIVADGQTTAGRGFVGVRTPRYIPRGSRVTAVEATEEFMSQLEITYCVQ